MCTWYMHYLKTIENTAIRVYEYYRKVKKRGWAVELVCVCVCVFVFIYHQSIKPQYAQCIMYD